MSKTHSNACKRMRNAEKRKKTDFGMSLTHINAFDACAIQINAKKRKQTHSNGV